MIKLLPLICSRNERQHWLIDTLRELRDKNVHLESLRMNPSTHRTLIDYNSFIGMHVGPLECPSFAGLPIVITRSYSYLQVFFSDVFMEPRMPGGSMDDAVYLCEPLSKAGSPLTDPLTWP